MDFSSQAHPRPSERRSSIVFQWADGLVRLVLLAAALVILRPSADAPSDAHGKTAYGLLVAAGTLLGYFLLTKQEVRQLVKRATARQPLLMGLLPAALPAPALALMPFEPTVDFAEVAFYLTLFVLPPSAVLLDQQERRRVDASLGVTIVALPTLALLVQSNQSSELFALSGWDWALRAVMLLMPAALLLAMRVRQPRDQHFLRICGLLSAWLIVEFKAFPTVPLVGNGQRGYFDFAVLLLLAYTVAVGSQEQVAISFVPTPRGLSAWAANLGFAVALILPLGLATQPLTFQVDTWSAWDVLGRWLELFLFTALPREMFLRGVLLAHLVDNLRLSRLTAVVATSALTALLLAAQMPQAWWGAAVGVVIGAFGGRAFLSTRNLTVPALLHAALHWVVWLLFGN
ncbi:MAG: type II CAAX prenyl endopeptidase Rce1 family protein [Thermoflexales bacterium]